MPDKPRVAERLIQLREDLGLSQEEAAARTEGAIKLRQWQRWESGESEPYKRNLAKLSETFGIPIAEFFEDRPQLDQTQLDRIEQKLDDLIAAIAPTRPEGADTRTAAGTPAPGGELGRRLAESDSSEQSQQQPDSPEEHDDQRRTAA